MNQLEPIHDLLVIGGGINGVGIAADAAGRGLDVLLCEKNDLAAATSSSSSKLIHGGLRYLENYEFKLVRKALIERELLTGAAQHIIHPLAFHIPQLPHSRNSLLLRAGLFLYDHLAKREHFPGSRRISMDASSPLNAAIKKGFEYWDAQVDDSRLVVLNALQAESKGARILTRTECIAVEETPAAWRVTLRDKLKKQNFQLNCKVIVNASGPWVASLAETLRGKKAKHDIRLVKGSHIIVPKIHEGKQAYLLQHHDGRIVFVIPYLENFTLIGTTEEEFSQELDNVEISEDEIKYLLSIVNLYFTQAIYREDIVHSYSGVRPLIEEANKEAGAVSREYSLELEDSLHPLLSVFGGKLTSYRILAEEAVDKLKVFFPHMKARWTRKAKLPGGDFEITEELFKRMASRYGWLGPDIISRWLNSYGTLSFDIIKAARGKEDLGVKFGHNLYQLEVDYLCQHEWARNADDILWRRSKLGLYFSATEKRSLENYIAQSFPPS